MPKVFFRNLSQAALRTLASFRKAVSALFSSRKSQNNSRSDGDRPKSRIGNEESNDACSESIDDIARSENKAAQEEEQESLPEEMGGDARNSNPPAERPNCIILRRRSRRLTGIDLAYQPLPPSTSGDDLLKWTLVKEALSSKEPSLSSSFSSLSSMRFSSPSLVQMASPSELTSSNSSQTLSSPPSTTLSFVNMRETDKSSSSDTETPSKTEAASQVLEETVLQEGTSRFLAPPVLNLKFGLRSVESLSDYYSALSC